MEEFIRTLCFIVPPVVLLFGILYLYLDKRKDKCKNKSSVDNIKCCVTEETVQQQTEQYQQLQDTVPVEDTIQELSKNEITFLANKQTIELTNIISNIVAKEFNSSVQDYNNSVKEFVQESVDKDIEQQVSNVPVQHETDNIDLNQYHAYNNEYNQPTYKKPSPIVSVGKDDACNVESTQRDIPNISTDTVNPVINKIIQDQINQSIQDCLADSLGMGIEEQLCRKRNRSYLAPTRKLTPEGRYNHYVEQLTKKHNEYIDFKLRLNRTIRLAKDAGLTEEVIDDILNTGDKDKYLITGVNKYE